MRGHWRVWRGEIGKVFVILQTMARFDFKQFSIDDSGCGMKICSDSVLLGAWFLPQVSAAEVVVDAGAGSGLLSLMAAQVCPLAVVTAVEIEPDACRAAALNFGASPWKDRLRTVEGDFCSAGLPEAVDAVISNPPYFTSGELAPDSARAGARHQQTLTFGTLAARSRALLKPGGRLGLVAPSEAESDILFSAELAGLKLRRLCRVVTSPGKAPRRVLMDFSTADGPTDTAELCLRAPGGTLTDRYRALVEPFYLKIS